MAVSAIHTGWRWDRGNARLDKYYRGTRIGHISADGETVVGTFSTSGALTVDAGGLHVTAGFIGLADDVSIELGTDDDSVIRHRTATLAANTALTDVLVGTPVSQALAANSTMLSNVTASGDIALYVNTTTNSEQALFVDGSASIMYFGQTGWALNILEGVVKLTLGTVSAFGTTQPTNAIVLRAGTAPAGAITTAAGIYATATGLNKIVAGGTADSIQT